MRERVAYFQSLSRPSLAASNVHDVLLGLDATVLAICHRLRHVSRFDACVVMDRGLVVERGAASALLADPSSRLSGLVARQASSAG